MKNSRTLMLITAVVPLFASDCTSPRVADGTAGPTTAQRVLIDGWTIAHPGWRVAMPADNPKIAELHRAGIPAPDSPYFVTNAAAGGDGSFAVALVKADSFKVFYGRWDGSNYMPLGEVTSVEWLDRARLMLHADTLDIGQLSSDDIFTFVWDSQMKAMRPKLATP